MARTRKRHVQQPLPFRGHGGKRPGAGRPPNGDRAGEPHARRPRLTSSQPAHITLRVASDVGRLRTRDMYHAVRIATHVASARDDFRIVHLSIQHDHIHLIAEAGDRMALSRGIRAFEISAARRINTVASRRRHAPRRGRVFPDRYHAHIVDSPRAARHALRYVINNWRKHGEHERREARSWLLDPFSSGLSFPGWKELEDQLWRWRPPDGYLPLPVALPRTWLLREGWRRAGGISLFDVPGGTSAPRRYRRQPSAAPRNEH